MKLCPRCGEERLLSEFAKHSTRRGGSGLQWSCKSCQADISRAYREAHHEQIREKERAYRNSLPGWKYQLLNSARYRVQKMGVPCSITVDDFEIPGVCPALGMKLTHGGRGGTGPMPSSASLDRINPELGYVPGNVQVMSQRANAMKSDASPEELYKFATWVIEVVGMNDLKHAKSRSASPQSAGGGSDS